MRYSRIPYTLPLILAAASAAASETGHFAPGTLGPIDLVLPGPGWQYVQYNIYYDTDQYRDQNGHRLNSLTVNGHTVNLDINVDSWEVAPGLLWASKDKILGANYGFFVLQPVGNLGIDASLSMETAGIRAKDSTFGLGDSFVEPVWLRWDMDDNSAGLSYGVYIPDGKYSAGSPSNVGLGFWTNEFQILGAHYFDDHKATMLTSSLTYEIHGRKDGLDLTPGQDLTFHSGIMHMMPISDNWVGHASITGYGEWQITDDRGSDATNPTVRDRVYGAGLQAGLSYAPLGTFDLRWTHELDAVDRFQGNYYLFVLDIPFQ